MKERLGEAGLTEFKFFSSAPEATHHTQAFVTGNANFIVVAFRGTEPAEPKDFLTDILFLQEDSSEGEGLVHVGFNDALDEVWDEIAVHLGEARDHEQTVWFTGHSLGAALAVIAADRYGKAAGVYTFGSPRTGDAEFAQGINDRLAGKSFRLVNNVDIVAELPPAGFYRHVGVLKYFDRDHELEDAPSGLVLIEDQMKAQLNRFSVIVGDWSDLEFNRVAVKDLEDHAPIHYAIHTWNHYIREAESEPGDGH